MYYVRYLDDWLQRRLHDDVMVERWIRCRCCVLFHNAAAAAAAAAVMLLVGGTIEQQLTRSFSILTICYV